MPRTNGHIDLNSLLAGILVVFISVAAALLSTQDRPQKTTTSFEAFAHAEGVLKRSGMP